MDKVPDYNIIPSLLTPSQTGLFEAGKIFEGAHVCESEQSAVLMEMATRHSQYQADHRQQGHQLWDKRVKELFKTLGQYTYSEIAAESWPEQAEASMLELGTEMYNCWRKSSGHWSVASKKHKYMGGDMKMGKDNIWYATIIVGD
jgi:hypothetical protein